MARQTYLVDRGWTFRQADDDDSKSLPVSQFPTCVHLDLMHHGLIPDSFIGKNESKVQWVGETDWTYKTIFPSPSIEDGQRVVLAFDGLDTYATVRLNGQQILRTEDMFIPERVDVTTRLVEHNELEILFESAWLIGKKAVEKDPNHKWGCWNGDPSRTVVRKAQYHYGWDWGPMLMTCGPWRPVSLETFISRISDLHFRVDVAEDLKSATILATVDIEREGDEVVFEMLSNQEIVTKAFGRVEHGAASTLLTVINPKLWYPKGYGNQNLYTLVATLKGNNTELDKSSKRLGLRRARVVQKPLLGQPGTSFYFEVNKIPIFCGGSDWIPADNFLPRINPQKYHDWVQLVADGNQVMIRVWGGGIFEHQAFYDACDSAGVLVWQDFMFACANYPAHDSFLKLVDREARENVKLLRHHPSIVIWAGNNEDYQYQESEGLTYDPDDKDPSSWLRTDFPARYIYEKLLADVCRDLVPDTLYHYGSPFAGSNTRDPTIGDTHQWNVWHGSQEKYQNFDLLISRFVSEFGMEAFPSIKTVDSYLLAGKDDPERYAQSSTVDFHNKADGHERRLALYLAENIRYSPEPIEQYIYSTQLMQAECLATAYRLWKRQWQGPGREYCAGALVWQVNDCWPVTSWAIADYYLRPKLSYYAIKRELAPITIGTKRTVTHMPRDQYSNIPIITQHRLQVWATNLTLATYSGLRVILRAWSISTGKMFFSRDLHGSCALQPNRSSELAVVELPVQGDGLSDPDTHLDTVTAAYLYKGKDQLARFVSWPEPLKYAHLQKPAALKVEIVEGGVELSAEVPVKGVALECEDDAVKWQDNCVDLVPGETIRIGVEGLRAGNEGQVTVRHLN